MGTEKSGAIFKDLPTGRFNLIVVDPPWPMDQFRRKKTRPNQGPGPLPYKTLSLEIIETLPIPELLEDHAVCFIWTTQRFLPASLNLLKKWGLRYQRCVTWDKGGGMCLFGFHHRTEFAVFGFCGKIETFPKRKAFPTVICEKSRGHSMKPDIFYTLASPFGDRRIDMFARQKRKGWSVWGDEINLITSQ